MNPENCVILLAEDDPNDVLLFRRALDKLKLANSLQSVQDGEEAISYLGGQGLYADRDRYPLPTLLLLDLKLPRKAGFEVLQWLRGQPGLKRLPAVVLTSSNQDSDINRAYDLGANSYLVKPGDFDGLVGIIKNLQAYWLTLNEKPELEPKQQPVCV
jgi:CheY-like chemotaxis protein